MTTIIESRPRCEPTFEQLQDGLEDAALAAEQLGREPNRRAATWLTGYQAGWSARFELIRVERGARSHFLVSPGRTRCGIRPRLWFSIVGSTGAVPSCRRCARNQLPADTEGLIRPSD
jgi:hypothetical protein